MAMAGMTVLTPQEAYYWTWSRFPDFSYYDHPPLASYSIWLTTRIFGSTAFGVKMAAVLWSLGWNLLWLQLIKDMFADRRLAWWSLLALNCTVLYELYGLGATPDGPLLFGWTGTVWAVWRAVQARHCGWWLLAGAFLGLALLGKYPAILLLPAIGLFLLLAPERRHWLVHPGPWAAVAVALLLFSPVLYWNAQHDWVSFAFQTGRRAGEVTGLKPRYFALLLATQTLLLTPWILWLGLRGFWDTGKRLWSSHADAASSLLWCSALVPLSVFGAASFVANGKLNWLIPAWWSLVILGMRHSLSRPAGIQRRLGLACALVLLLAASALATQPDWKLPRDLNLASGWQEAAARVDGLVAAERQAGGRAFVFSPHYKISSLLWIYRPSQERTYSNDIWGGKSLQYGHFPRNENLEGATGFLVLSDQSQSKVDMDHIARFFQSMEFVESIEKKSGGILVRRIEIWRGRHYTGSASSAKGS